MITKNTDKIEMNATDKVKNYIAEQIKNGSMEELGLLVDNAVDTLTPAELKEYADTIRSSWDPLLAEYYVFLADDVVARGYYQIPGQSVLENWKYWKLQGIEFCLCTNRPILPDSMKPVLYPLTKKQLLSSLENYASSMLVDAGRDKYIKLSELIESWRDLKDDDCPIVKDFDGSTSPVYDVGKFTKDGVVMAIALDPKGVFNSNVKIMQEKANADKY